MNVHELHPMYQLYLKECQKLADLQERHSKQRKVVSELDKQIQCLLLAENTHEVAFTISPEYSQEFGKCNAVCLKAVHKTTGLTKKRLDEILTKFYKLAFPAQSEAHLTEFTKKTCTFIWSNTKGPLVHKVKLRMPSTRKSKRDGDETEEDEEKLD